MILDQAAVKAELSGIDEETMRKLERIFNLERERRLKAQAEGFARARKNGVLFGRPRIQAKHLDEAIALCMSKKLSISEAAKLCGISRSTFYRRYREYIANNYNNRKER